MSNELLKIIYLPFSKEIIKKIRSLRLPVDHIGSILFILFALYEERYDLLDEFDDDSREKRAMMLYRDLERKELLERIDDEVIYRLTDKGMDMIEFVKEQMQQEIRPEILEVKAMREINDSSEIDSWIKDYIKLFPSGKLNGRYYRTSFRDVSDRMRWFIKTYGYGRDVILAATKYYVQSFNGDYEKMRNSSYFIWKRHDETREKFSDLAVACENYMYDQEEPKAEPKINLDIA